MLCIIGKSLDSSPANCAATWQATDVYDSLHPVYGEAEFLDHECDLLCTLSIHSGKTGIPCTITGLVEADYQDTSFSVWRSGMHPYWLHCPHASSYNFKNL